MLISPCGALCEECPFYKNPCKGCRNLEGKVFWSGDAAENGICPIYDCSVNTKEVGSCGKCSELPCKLFFEMKDTNISEEEHQESIVKRAKLLRRNTE